MSFKTITKISKGGTMKKKITSVIGVVCLIFTMSSVLGAQIDVISISPTALRSANDGSLQIWFGAYFDIPTMTQYFGTYAFSLGAFSYYLIPLTLPEGKIIKWMKLHFYDNNTTAGYQLECWLVRVNKYVENGNPQEIYKVDTAGSWGDIVAQKTDLTPASPARALIINKACHYYLMIDFNAANTNDVRLYGVSLGIQ